MKRSNQKDLWAALGLLMAFGLWTAAVQICDVRPIGPEGTAVGLAALNGWFHHLTGVHMALYTLTDWLGLVPLLVVLGFALLGLIQLIQRRSLLKVDHSILALGGFYILVLGAYVLFEFLVINYRPVLIEGRLEASYPSSTTMLALCVMPTAIMQVNRRVKGEKIRRVVSGILAGFAVFMAVGRMLSGVHWLSDIIGGVLLSGALVLLYGWIDKRLP